MMVVVTMFCANHSFIIFQTLLVLVFVKHGQHLFVSQGCRMRLRLVYLFRDIAFIRLPLCIVVGIPFCHMGTEEVNDVRHLAFRLTA